MGNRFRKQFRGGRRGGHHEKQLWGGLGGAISNNKFGEDGRSPFRTQGIWGTNAVSVWGGPSNEEGLARNKSLQEFRRGGRAKRPRDPAPPWPLGPIRIYSPWALFALGLIPSWYSLVAEETYYIRQGETCTQHSKGKPTLLNAKTQVRGATEHSWP